MGTIERRERERQELRTKILDAARELFVDEGYEAVTMRKIAERIEYSPTAIYLHFRDKKAVMRRALRRRLPRARQAVPEDREDRRPDRAPAQDRPRLRRLRAQHPNHYRLMFMTPHPRSVTRGQRARSAATPRRTPTPSSRGRSPRRSRRAASAPSSPTPTCLARWSGRMHGVVSLHIAKCNDAWVDWRPTKRTAHAMIDMMIRGLAREEPS